MGELKIHELEEDSILKKEGHFLKKDTRKKNLDVPWKEKKDGHLMRKKVAHTCHRMAGGGSLSARKKETIVVLLSNQSTRKRKEVVHPTGETKGR